MATIRRLSDEDVKAVFDCVHNNRPPPADLPFHLVNVGPNGLKLSPPSYEFEGAIAYDRSQSEERVMEKLLIIQNLITFIF